MADGAASCGVESRFQKMLLKTESPTHGRCKQKKLFEDFGEAAKALREAYARRDSIFQQGVEAQKNKDDVLAKKFAEAVKKAKETPLGERPLRDFDLD